MKVAGRRIGCRSFRIEGVNLGVGFKVGCRAAGSGRHQKDVVRGRQGAQVAAGAGARRQETGVGAVTRGDTG